MRLHLHLVVQNKWRSQVEVLVEPVEQRQVVEVDVQRVLLVHLHLHHQHPVNWQRAIVRHGSYLCYKVLIVVVVRAVVQLVWLQCESTS